jgi:hypothetical protein
MKKEWYFTVAVKTIQNFQNKGRPEELLRLRLIVNQY